MEYYKTSLFMDLDSEGRDKFVKEIIADMVNPKYQLYCEACVLPLSLSDLRFLAIGRKPGPDEA